MKKDIDKLLEWHFHHQPDYSRLNGLEEILLRKITQESINKPWFEHSLDILVRPRFQFAALGLSLLIGFSAGLALPWLNEAPSNINNFEKSMSVFALNSAFLPSTVLNTTQALRRGN